MKLESISREKVIHSQKKLVKHIFKIKRKTKLGKLYYTATNKFTKNP